ncbi:MAG: phospholipase D family protein [Flavipsychrobacter sp.]
MALAIFLRKRVTVNKFRELLLASLNSGLGDEAIICSGFFQENYNGSSYQVSTDGSIIAALTSNNINLKTIGIHNYAWLQSYRNFRDNLRAAGVSIDAKVTRSYRWHAKIYILKKDSAPIFAIIGSSNMTRNAYGITTPFNFEADVMLWTPQFNVLLETDITELGQFPDEVIVADYDPKKNWELSIEDRLEQLARELDNISLTDLS